METAVDAEYTTGHISEDLLRSTAETFTGEILQKPPVFSALKKDGKRLYEYARKGKPVEIARRKVEISNFDFTRIELPEIDFRVRCSKGTYIRSLADEFGQAMDCGAYLSALKRTKIGSYNVNKAISPDEFKDVFRQAGFDL